MVRFQVQGRQETEGGGTAKKKLEGEGIYEERERNGTEGPKQFEEEQNKRKIPKRMQRKEEESIGRREQKEKNESRNFSRKENIQKERRNREFRRGGKETSRSDM